jgi:uncharacterized cupin superfamily protein
VISGEIVCILEDGEVTVRAGDVLVQRATLHAWENRGTEPFVTIVVMTTERRSVLPLDAPGAAQQPLRRRQ